jgi:hypothetical protein
MKFKLFKTLITLTLPVVIAFTTVSCSCKTTDSDETSKSKPNKRKKINNETPIITTPILFVNQNDDELNLNLESF